MNEVLPQNATIDHIARHPIRYPYEVVKNVFERNHFKVKMPLSFVRVTDNGQQIIYNCGEIRELYRCLYCDIVGHINGTNRYRKKRFIDHWLDDVSKRNYKTLNFYPPPLQCPVDEYNMWNGFTIDKIECESSMNVHPFLDHINILVNHDSKDVEIFIKWAAQIIQEPGILTGKAVILSSQEALF